jgi:hypothetical protein
VVDAGVVLLVDFLIAVILLAAGALLKGARARGVAAATLAALPLGTAALLSVYVFGEDSYRGNGVTRWNAYRSPGGALGPMFVVSVVVMVVSAALIVYASLRNHGRLLRTTSVFAGAAALLLITPTVIGFSSN